MQEFENVNKISQRVRTHGQHQNYTKLPAAELPTPVLSLPAQAECRLLSPPGSVRSRIALRWKRKRPARDSPGCTTIPRQPP